MHQTRAIEIVEKFWCETQVQKLRREFSAPERMVARIVDRRSSPSTPQTR
jgi:hypothetical protein